VYNVDALGFAIVIFVNVPTAEACGLGADFVAYILVEDCVADGGDFG